MTYAAGLTRLCGATLKKLPYNLYRVVLRVQFRTWRTYPTDVSMPYVYEAGPTS